jgi:hypothetical protein
VDPSASTGLDRILRRAYGAGAILCLGLPLALQAGLPRLIHPGGNPAGEALRQIGYTFTGLSILVLALAVRRVRTAQAALPGLEPSLRPAAAARATLLASALILLCAVFGCLYWALGGGNVERHARTFLALSPVGFLLFVPRPSRWRPAEGQSRA